MKQSALVLLSLLGCAVVLGCGGKSVVTNDSASPDADAGDDASSGTGGSGTGGSAGVGGSADGGMGGTASSDGGAGGTGGTGVPPCAFATGLGDCDACMNASCADQCNTCAAGTECSAFVTCALACSTGDAACMQDCVSQHEAGVQDGLPLIGPDGCLRNSCNAQCIVAGELCSLSLGDPACDECVAGYCMAECTTCAGNDACVSLVDCAQACAPDDQACVMGCGIADPGGIGDAKAFAGTGGCVEKHCAVQCKGAPSRCPLSVGDATCDACVSSQCLTPCNTCAGNDACVALVQCAAGCAPDDQSCINACGMQNPMGIADAQAFMGSTGCVPQKCPAQCGQGASTCTVQTGNAGCDQCVATQCAGACSACSDNPDCLALVACNLGCDPNDIGCTIQCGTDHPGGLQDAAPLIGPTGCVGADCSFWCP